jgi:type II secretory pathway pseudopilin PulG
MGINGRKSFTLIETIVVIAVIGLILPVVFSIFFILLQQQTKIYRLNTVKKEGDYLINIIENTIKNEAKSIHSAGPPTDSNIECSTENSAYGSNQGLYFLNNNNQWFEYLLNGEAIASASGSTPTPTNLTSTKTKISSFSISCSKNNLYSPPSISLSFNIEYCGDVSCTQTRPEETASLFYQTKIKLRNY